MKNENTKIWFLKFYPLRQSSVKRYNVWRKDDVIFVLSSGEIFPTIFSNETVALSCSISILKTIYAKHKPRRPKRGHQWEYSEKYQSENITLSPCYHAIEE